MTIEKTEAKKKVCVSLTQQDYERLRGLSEKNSRTMPGYIRWLLHAHFKDPHAEKRS